MKAKRQDKIGVKVKGIVYSESKNKAQILGEQFYSVFTEVGNKVDKLPTMYWLPKLKKRPYKARFIANSSSCTTTELSKVLTSCLTVVKNHATIYCEKVYERPGKNFFWSI